MVILYSKKSKGWFGGTSAIYRLDVGSRRVVYFLSSTKDSSGNKSIFSSSGHFGSPSNLLFQRSWCKKINRGNLINSSLSDRYAKPAGQETGEGDNDIYPAKLDKLMSNAGRPKGDKLPISSNGPPLIAYLPYLSHSGRAPRQALPLSEPHRLHPIGLPRPSAHKPGGKPKRISRSPFQCDDLPRKLADDIKSLGSARHVKEVLDKRVRVLNKGCLAKTIRELGRMKLTERVLQVLLWLQEQPYLWPDETTLCAVMHVMVEAGEVEIALNLQKTLGSNSHKAAQSLTVVLAKFGMWEDAVQVLKFMAQSGWRADSSFHARLTVWASQLQLRETVESLLKDVKQKKLKLTEEDYISILSACSRVHLVHEIMNFIEQYKVLNLRLNIVMYTTLICALSREGKYREAIALFWDIEQAGCAPDLTAYQVMINVCRKAGEFNKAAKVYKSMKDAGFSPTPDIYNNLIELYQKHGHGKGKMMELVKEMELKGYSSALVSSLSNHQTPR